MLSQISWVTLRLANFTKRGAVPGDTDAERFDNAVRKTLALARSMMKNNVSVGLGLCFGAALGTLIGAALHHSGPGLVVGRLWFVDRSGNKQPEAKFKLTTLHIP